MSDNRTRDLNSLAILAGLCSLSAASLTRCIRGGVWSGRHVAGLRRMAAERLAMSHATAAGVFIAVSLVVIVAAWLIVRGYVQRR